MVKTRTQYNPYRNADDSWFSYTYPATYTDGIMEVLNNAATGKSKRKNKFGGEEGSTIERSSNTTWEKIKNFAKEYLSYMDDVNWKQKVVEKGATDGYIPGPIKWMAIDAVHNLIPFNYTFTNWDLPQKALKEAANIADSIARTDYPEQYNRMINDSIPFTIGIKGYDYARGYGNPHKSLEDKLITPRGQVENTLGSYTATLTPYGTLINDPSRYDFNSMSFGAAKATPYGLARTLATSINTPEYEYVHKKIPVVLSAPKQNENYMKNKAKMDEMVKQRKKELKEENRRSKEYSKTQEGQEKRKREKKQFDRDKDKMWKNFIEDLMSYLPHLP